VDDHRATLLTLSLIIRGAGYRCVTATEFNEAERVFVLNQIDLVILDHGLPGINGTDLAAHLKRIRAVVVVMLTGNTELTEKLDVVDLLLAKPQLPEHLLCEIAKLLKTA
jgi:two-component system, OmpR family, KDP operon response regulator KdpE